MCLCQFAKLFNHFVLSQKVLGRISLNDVGGWQKLITHTHTLTAHEQFSEQNYERHFDCSTNFTYLINTHRCAAIITLSVTRVLLVTTTYTSQSSVMAFRSGNFREIRWNFTINRTECRTTLMVDDKDGELLFDMLSCNQLFACVLLLWKKF